MFKKLKSILICSILFCGVSQGQIRSTWTVGIDGSVEYFLHTLIDAERFDLDSTTVLGITDPEYLQLRKDNDLNYIGYTAGLFAAYKMSAKAELETGIRLVEGGVKLNTSGLTDFRMITLAGAQNFGNKVANPYRILEVPVLMKHRLGNPPKHDLGSRRAGTPLVTTFRYFFVSYGLGIGYPINGNELYNGLEYQGITSNMGVAALGGIGYHIDTRWRLYFNIRAHARATILSYYEYAPIKSYYNAFGAEVKIGYRLAANEDKGNGGKPTDCVSFTDNPVGKSRPKYMMGLRYGLNTNMLIGGSANDVNVGLKGPVASLDPDVESASGDVYTIFTPHVGLHFEYLLGKHLSIGLSPTWSQRGYRAKYTYFLDDERTIKSRQRVYLDYIDLPLRISYYPTEKLWAHAGAAVSFLMDDRLFNYYQVYDGLANFPNDNINYRDDGDVQGYFGYPADGFVMGYEMGVGYHLDEHVAISTQMTIFENMFTNDNGHAQLKNLTWQISMYYFFLTKK